MLIEFTVENYRSIKNKQVLSMVKGKGGELADSNYFESGIKSGVSLLHTAAIYGANAAGKSNVIKALHTMESIVRGSASDSQQDDEIPVTPFLFDEESPKKPTEFEVVFVNEGIRYQYGFSVTKKLVLEEWLIAYPKGRPQKWFSRTFNKETNSPEFELGGSLTGKKTVWQGATRNNALFLSTAILLNSDQLKPVYNWFTTKLRVAGLGGWSVRLTAASCENSETKQKILRFLENADLNIHDVLIEKEKFNPDGLPDAMPESIKADITRAFKNEDFTDIKTVHKTSTGQLVNLDFKDESDGTQKFFSFVGPWIYSLENGYILIIDELHDNLHPKLVKHLVELFHNPITNPRNAQLIFTTHETSILNQDIFRRDQIWFCEKNSAQETSLFPLTNFSPRKGRENIELGYLSGRYGALPFTKDINFSEEV